MVALVGLLQVRVFGPARPAPRSPKLQQHIAVRGDGFGQRVTPAAERRRGEVRRGRSGLHHLGGVAQAHAGGQPGTQRLQGREIPDRRRELVQPFHRVLAPHAAEFDGEQAGQRIVRRLGDGAQPLAAHAALLLVQAHGLLFHALHPLVVFRQLAPLGHRRGVVRKHCLVGVVVAPTGDHLLVVRPAVGHKTSGGPQVFHADFAGFQNELRLALAVAFGVLHGEKHSAVGLFPGRGGVFLRLGLVRARQRRHHAFEPETPVHDGHGGDVLAAAQRARGPAEHRFAGLHHVAHVAADDVGARRDCFFGGVASRQQQPGQRQGDDVGARGQRFRTTCAAPAGRRGPASTRRWG